ncbi:hypothetical protein ABLA30_05500 [Xenorhabdus nematophila]|uniref:hypothetical protein n=1 Tax=Xenorhabdus nematophila TaxID=628 RepID=UPI0032B85F91
MPFFVIKGDHTARQNSLKNALLMTFSHHIRRDFVFGAGKTQRNMLNVRRNMFNEC